MGTTYLNSGGMVDILAREFATRRMLTAPQVDGDPLNTPAQVHPHALFAFTPLEDGKSSFEIDFGFDSPVKSAAQQLLQNNDAFFPVGASLVVGKVPIIGGKPQYGMAVWTTFASPKIFDGAAVGTGPTEEQCVRTLFETAKYTWKAGSDELMFEQLGRNYKYVPETQDDPATGLVSGTGSIQNMDRFRFINKPFGYVGSMRNKVLISIPEAITTQIMADAATVVAGAATTEINVIGFELFGSIVRGGADPVLNIDKRNGNNGNGKYCLPA